MTPPRRRDLRLLALALLLFAVPAIWFAWSSRDARERREATLAGVPEFPAPHQPPRHRPFSPETRAAAPVPAPVVSAPGVARADPITSFVLASSTSPVALVHVNALFNTPLLEKLRACMPGEFHELEKSSAELGFDVTRDLDQVAMTGKGIAMSGFFEGKPVARTLLGANARDDRSYRGQAIQSNGTSCAVQMGNLVLVGPSNDCESLIDRALTPPAPDAAEEVYGDVFFRTDLQNLHAGDDAPQLEALLQAMQGVTVRANVWDSVALTLEGSPRGSDARDLARMARGAVSVFKSQLDDEDVELRTLADLAEVSSRDGKLELDLALPAKDLWDKLHLPCAVERDGG